MGSSNVVQFPKEKSLRKIWYDKSQNQKAALSLSLASVLVVTLFVNEWISRSHQNQAELAGQGRGLASVGQLNEQADIQWEHDLARKLASAELARPAVVAQKPSLRDELVFGRLQGKYGVKAHAGKVTEIEFLNQQAGDEPLNIQDKKAFLQQYSTVLGHEIAQVSLKSSAKNQEVYSLVDSKNNIVGAVQFGLDDQGRVLNLKITE